MTDEYKIAKPRKPKSGAVRIALVPDAKLGGVHIIFLRGDVRALMPVFGGGWRETEDEAIRDASGNSAFHRRRGQRERGRFMTLNPAGREIGRAGPPKRCRKRRRCDCAAHPG
jgi:hypothetical protein